MKRNRILIIVFITLLSSCKEKEKVIQREVAFYPNDSLRFEVKLIDGKREGAGIDYFENGKIKAKSFWKNGIMDGEQLHYYENGNVRQISQYREGLCQKAKDYTEDGFLEEIRDYDSLGRIFDYWKFKKDGKRDFGPGTKDPVFIPEVDTIVVGEYLMKEIRLGNRQYSHVDVIIGDISDQKIIKKNKPLPKKDSLTSILKIKADSVGFQEISGVVFERNQTWDSMDVIPFTHRYYVKKK